MDGERNWYTFTRDSIEKIPEGHCGSYRIADINKKRIYTGYSMNPKVGIRGKLISHLFSKDFPAARYFRFGGYRQ